MFKKVALGFGVATLACASVASASTVRPAAVNLQPTVAQNVALPAPVKVHVRKKNGAIPVLVIGIVALAAVGAGIGFAASSGSPS